jgi:hypothetical protein
MQSKHDALHELAYRARVERSLYIAEAISSAIFAVHGFIKRVVGGNRAASAVKPAPVPATQR